MFWHLDADIVSLLVIISLFVYFIFTQSEEKLNRSDNFFLLMLVVGGIATVIDIIASAIMNTSISLFWYYFFMTLYFLGFLGIILIWFYYNTTLIFSTRPKISKYLNWIFTVPFVLYLGFLFANLWIGWLFKISDEGNVYSRGPLFLLVVLLYCFYPVVVLLIATIQRKTIPDTYPFLIFIFSPFLLIIGVIFQLVMKGWLLILPTYMLSIIVTFLFLQAKQYKINEMTKEQIRNYTTHVPCGLIIGSVNSKHQFIFQNINQAYFDLLEEPREFMQARYKKDIFAGIHIQDRPILEEKIKDLCNYHRDQEFVYRFVTRKNKVKWLHAQVKAIHNEDNTAISYITISEITSLMDKITQFQTVFESIPCGISIFKCKEKNIHHLYHNQRLLDILGIRSIDRYTNFDDIDLSLVDKEDAEKLRGITLETLKDRNPLTVSYRFYNPKRSKFLKIKTEIHKMLDSDGNDIIFLVYTDETNLREEAKE